MDEAFAGGVCRCEHCGAIQTVPGRHAGKSQALKPAKTLYKKRVRDDAIPSSGLDQLAQAIAGSGLSSSLDRAAAPRKRWNWTRITAAFLLIAGLLAAAMMFMPSPKPSAARVAPSAAANQAGQSSPQAIQAAMVQPAQPLTPSFCGVPIQESSVIYVLDRGSGTADVFSFLKEATFKSVESLGADRKFQIVFWNNGSDDAYPAGGTTSAKASEIEEARKSLDAVFAHGQTEVASALAHAVAADPKAIILATAKGAQLDDGFVEQVMHIVKGHSTKVHTFDLSGLEASSALQAIARRSGGEFHLVSESELRKAARD
ncbi:MAG TPA: hypothetical protein VHD56_00340 [Tepidisphaeraceae bacterium]|nr:hypothetical protein [Tepidisphaeraceae bacterium]